MKGQKTAPLTKLKNSLNNDSARAEYYRLLVNSTVEGLIIHKDGIALEVNDPLLRLFGYERDQLIGQNLIDILPAPEDQPTVSENVRKKRSKPYQARARRKDGTFFFAEVEGRNIEIQGEECRLTSVRDISEKVRADKALKESELKFKSLIMALPDIALVVGLDGSIIFSNDQLEIQTSYKADEIQLGKYNPLIYPDDREIFTGNFKKIKSNRSAGSLSFECRFTSVDGEIIWYHTIFSRINYEGETAIQIVSRNITDSKKVELELKEHKDSLQDLVGERTKEINKLNKDLLSSNRELTKLNTEISRQNIDLKSLLLQLKSTQRQLVDSEKLASVGKLTAGLAHELNNPLNWVAGVLRPIQQNLFEISKLADAEHSAQLIEETNELFASIRLGTDKITHIVKNLSDITPKGNLGKIEFIQLAELVENNIATLESRFPEVEFEIEIFEELELYTNGLDIQQVFFNLIKNAAEAVENMAGHVHVKVSQQGDGIKCTVADNGPGISEGLEKEIFEPFFTTREEDKYLGLGLYIVKSIISKYNGSIFVNSKRQSGTLITFSLPGVIKKQDPDDPASKN